MSDRKYDIVLLGASGFTGQRVVNELVASECKLRYAIAGRNLERLELVAAAAGIPNVPIIVADVHDEQSLLDMAKQTRVVITVVGPYRHYGEAVIKACITAGADCLDISGEPEYIENVEYSYGDAAKAAGVYIASAVGFDSVPGDVGAWWTAKQLGKQSRCTAIETFITIKSGPSGFRGHFPTYESAVYGFAHAKDLSSLRKKAAAKRGGRVNLNIPGPKLQIDNKPHFEGRPHVNKWVLPFMGSDASVVRRTCAAFAESGKFPAYHSAFYLTLPSQFYTRLFTLFGGVFSYLAGKAWGRRLLLTFPRLFSNGIFSHAGPSEQQMRETSFEMINIARAEDSDVQMTTRVAGPEPGYLACSIFVVAAAVALVEEREKLGLEPGVHTPAFLFQNTSYVDRIKARGITFEVIESKN